MRRAATFALAAVALALTPAGARAHHLTPAVTVDVAVGKADAQGRTPVTLRWNATCGDPAAGIAIGIGRVFGAKGRRKEVVEPVRWLKDPRQGPGELQVRVWPGMRFKPVVEARCRHVKDNDEQRASGEGRWIYLPPKLLSWNPGEGELCGFPPSDRRKRLQERMWARSDFTFLVDQLSLLERRDAGVVLHVRGAGVRTKVKPVAGIGQIPLTAKSSAQFDMPIFKRPGRVRVWLEFDGDRTNSLTIPVARLPSGCSPSAVS